MNSRHMSITEVDDISVFSERLAVYRKAVVNDDHVAVSAAKEALCEFVQHREDTISWLCWELADYQLALMESERLVSKLRTKLTDMLIEA